MTFGYVTHLVKFRDLREQVSWLMANIEHFQLENLEFHDPAAQPGYHLGVPATVMFFNQDDAAKFKLFFGDDN